MDRLPLQGCKFTVQGANSPSRGANSPSESTHGPATRAHACSIGGPSVRWIASQICFEGLISAHPPANYQRGYEFTSGSASEAFSEVCNTTIALLCHLLRHEANESTGATPQIKQGQYNPPQIPPVVAHTVKALPLRKTNTRRALESRHAPLPFDNIQLLPFGCVKGRWHTGAGWAPLVLVNVLIQDSRKRLQLLRAGGLLKDTERGTRIVEELLKVVCGRCVQLAGHENGECVSKHSCVSNKWCNIVTLQSRQQNFIRAPHNRITVRSWLVPLLPNLGMMRLTATSVPRNSAARTCARAKAHPIETIVSDSLAHQSLRFEHQRIIGNFVDRLLGPDKTAELFRSQSQGSSQNLGRTLTVLA
eukprot:1483590-Pyramimonas_sp.AAC.2